MNNINPVERLDRIFFGFLFGAVLPLFCFLIAIWIGFVNSASDRIIAISALSGLIGGLIISILIRLILKPDVYRIQLFLLVLIYLFYNICIFGFFMGVPVFNLVPGVVAGYYWVKRMITRNELNDKEKDMRRIPAFTSSVTGLVCIASATIALLSKSTPEDLKGMFHLKFIVTPTILITIIFVGGVLLVSLQYYLTRFVIKKTLTLTGN